MVFANYLNSTRTSEAWAEGCVWSFSLLSECTLVSGLIITGLGDQVPHLHKLKFLKIFLCFLLFEGSSLVILCYHRLPLATNRVTLRLPVYFKVFYQVCVVNIVRTLEVYYWLPLVTTTYR